MSLIKNLEIDGKQVQFTASDDITRNYRITFGMDISTHLRRNKGVVI